MCLFPTASYTLALTHYALLLHTIHQWFGCERGTFTSGQLQWSCGVLFEPIIERTSRDLYLVVLGGEILHASLQLCRLQMSMSTFSPSSCTTYIFSFRFCSLTRPVQIGGAMVFISLPRCQLLYQEKK